MGWLDRLTATVKADAHGVLDAIEDRPLMLKQRLREAEEALSRRRLQSQTLSNQLDATRKQLEQVRSRHAGLEARRDEHLGAELEVREGRVHEERQAAVHEAVPLLRQ